MTEEQLLSAALAHSAEGVSIFALDGTVQYMNAAAERMVGVRLADVRGQYAFDPDSDDAFCQAFARVAAGGEPEAFEHYCTPLSRWLANRIARVGDYVHVYMRDIADDVRMRRRLETLARIADVLTRNELDVAATAQTVTEILRDVIDADCLLAMLSSDREWLQPIAHTSHDPEVNEMRRTLRQWRADGGPPAEALRTRTAVLADLASIEREASAIVDPGTKDIVTRYAPTSVVAVPLFSGDDPLGVLVVSRRGDSAPLTHHDRTLLDEVGPSIALYVALARRRAEATSLRGRIMTLADSVPALVAFLDRDERYQFVSAGFERWLGDPGSSYLGRTAREVLGEETYATLKPQIDRVFAGELVRFRGCLAYPTGARDVDIQYIPLVGPDGRIEGYAALVQDITPEVRLADLERQQRETERRATARLESLLVVTASLAGAGRREDVERVLVDASADALEAASAAVWALSKDGSELVLVRERGMKPELAADYRHVKTTMPGPLTESVRTGRPVFATITSDDGPHTFGVLPMSIEGRVIGCLSFSFDDDRELTNDERMYLEVLALHGAEALRRANIYAELRDVSETRAAMIQASPAAIMLLDARGTVHAWNAAAERIFRIAARDVVGRELPALDQQPDVSDMLARVLAGEEIHGNQCRRMRADGEWFDTESHAAPVTLSDGRMMCLSMVLDISQRRRVERGRELIARASAIFARSLDWQRTLDEVVQLPFAHVADWCWVDLLGDDGTLHRVALSREEVAPGVALPRTLRHDQHIIPSKAIAACMPQVADDIDDAMLVAIAQSPQHLAALRALAPRSILSVPLVGTERTLGALTLGSRTRNFDDLDISIASELAHHAAIAIENARLYEDARNARREAEDANRAKDQFLAILGHELRNPLAPLVTAIELMRMRAPGQLERERAVIERQVDHLGRLVDDLLDVSRITRGKIDLRRERVTLASVVSKAIEQTSPLFDEHRHRLTVEVPGDLYVYADPTRLAQVVANLLSNAAKYTPRDGTIDITAARHDGRVELTVRDNGVGIAAEMLPHVFELFVQAPQPSARTRGGLGLGLTIVKSITELHGGTVEARSGGEGKGSVFTIGLPESTERLAVNQAERVPQLPRAAVARRILVVDDNEDAAKLLAEVLVAHGHHIRTALDGPTALRVADEFRPEVAVLDIGLPVMDGYELAERIRSTPNLADTRLIAVTGYGQESDRARALEAGFQAHLAKPVAIETLVRLVDGG